MLAERPRSRSEDLLVSLGFLLYGVPHASEITTVILKMQGFSGISEGFVCAGKLGSPPSLEVDAISEHNGLAEG